MSPIAGARYAAQQVPAAPPPDPTLIAGCVGDYDASDIASITASANRVSALADRSGTGHDVTQVTASSQLFTGVSTMNGRNVLTCTAPGQYLMRAPYGTAFPTGVTIVSVLRAADGTNQYGPPGFSSGWEGHPIYRIGTQAVYINSVADGFDAAPYDGTPHLHVFRAGMPAANYDLRGQDRIDGVNGPLIEHMPYGWDGAATGAWFTIGMRSDGAAHFVGDVAAVAIYGREVPDAELVPLETALRAYWATP